MTSTTTATSKLLHLLADGPGTSDELAAELGIGQRCCSANLHRLWTEGRIDRDSSPRKSDGKGAPAFLYGLIGVFKIPGERPPPRGKRVRVYNKRIRKYTYRDRREYHRLRRLLLASTLSKSQGLLELTTELTQELE